MEEWWLTLLTRISAWNPKSQHALANLEFVTNLPHESKARTLGELFEIAISTTRFNQFAHVIHSREQMDLLDPDKQLFSLMPTDSSLEINVKARSVMLGSFNQSRFVKIMQQAVLSDMIILSNHGHACSIVVKKGTLHFYAPNIEEIATTQTFEDIYPVIIKSLPGLDKISAVALSNDNVKNVAATGSNWDIMAQKKYNATIAAF